MLEFGCVVSRCLCVVFVVFFVFFFNDTATTEIYTLSLHDALPIWCGDHPAGGVCPEDVQVVLAADNRVDHRTLREQGAADAPPATPSLARSPRARVCVPVGADHEHVEKIGPPRDSGDRRAGRGPAPEQIPPSFPPIDHGGLPSGAHGVAAAVAHEYVEVVGAAADDVAHRGLGRSHRGESPAQVPLGGTAHLPLVCSHQAADAGRPGAILTVRVRLTEPAPGATAVAAARRVFVGTAEDVTALVREDAVDVVGPPAVVGVVHDEPWPADGRVREVVDWIALYEEDAVRPVRVLGAA